jgi:hypothetical protein
MLSGNIEKYLSTGESRYIEEIEKSMMDAKPEYRTQIVNTIHREIDKIQAPMKRNAMIGYFLGMLIMQANIASAKNENDEPISNIEKFVGIGIVLAWMMLLNRWLNGSTYDRANHLTRLIDTHFSSRPEASEDELRTAARPG